MCQDCYGTNIPSSTVTYPESSGFCEENPDDAYLSNGVTFGIVCNDGTFSNDILLECSSSHHEFFTTTDPYNLKGLRYLCSERTQFDSNSLTSDVHIVPSVSITTDEYWQSKTPASCYQQYNIDVTAPPVSVFVPVPTPIETTATPETAPSKVPVGDTPVLTPNAKSEIAPPILVTTTLSPMNSYQPSLAVLKNGTSSKEESGNSKVLLISAVGGVIGGIIISVLLFLVYSKGKNDGVLENKDEAFPPGKENSDTGNNTESQQSPNMQLPSYQSEARLPTIITATALASPAVATTSDFYEINYKDQSRSVIGKGSGHVLTSRSSNGNKTPPVVGRYYKVDVADNAKHTKPTSSLEIPTVAAIMCTEISLLGESDSSIRRLVDSNSSLRMISESNRSFCIPSESNGRSNTDIIKKASSLSSHLADSNSSLRMIGESNHSIHILDDSNSTIPTESNTDRKKPEFLSSAVEL